MQNNSRALFILKRREDYSTDMPNFTTYTVSTGMFNSATFVSDMLIESGITSEVITVIDNNEIDKEVTRFKPTHVFVEGYWVVPEKFDVLIPLHPTVKWFVRCHSEISFLAQEGIAIDWTYKYLLRGVGVAGNSHRINRELRVMAKASPTLNLTDEQVEDLIPLLTNYYPVSAHTTHHIRELRDVVDVGCFGAFRPLKNHMIQAVSAIDFAERRGLSLNFHVNSGRIELFGENSLKNLKALFNNLPQHKLIEHPWASHEDFLELINEMDICLQVSFTETFNIVTADAVDVGVPVVVSSEISWAHAPYADPTSSTDITENMNYVLSQHGLIRKNREKLREYSLETKMRWLNYLSGERPSIFKMLLVFIKHFFSN
jgi:hypothetical protein